MIRNTNTNNPAPRNKHYTVTLTLKKKTFKTLNFGVKIPVKSLYDSKNKSLCSGESGVIEDG